jgi:hypothetical protein
MSSCMRFMVVRGFVAQILWDSPCRLGRLGGGHEQAYPSDLPHDQLARHQRGPEGARLGSRIWFDPEMEWLAAPSGRRGRPATFSDAAIQTCRMRDGRCSGCLCGRRLAWWKAF